MIHSLVVCLLIIIQAIEGLLSTPSMFRAELASEHEAIPIKNGTIYQYKRVHSNQLAASSQKCLNSSYSSKGELLASLY